MIRNAGPRGVIKLEATLDGTLKWKTDGEHQNNMEDDMKECNPTFFFAFFVAGWCE